MKLTIKRQQEYTIELPDTKFLKNKFGYYFRINGDDTATVIKENTLEDIKLSLDPTITRCSMSFAFGWMTENQISELQLSNEDEFNNAIDRTLNTITNE
jgi:hypothetical protein